MFLKNYKNYKIYLGKNILAIDYGTKTIGLGIFCPGKDPFPLLYGKIVNETLPQIFEELAAIIDNEQVDIIVLGIPFLLDGQKTDMTQLVTEFGEKLKNNFPATKIFLQDETLSSYEAETRMKNSPKYNFKIDKDKLDALSPTIIF